MIQFPANLRALNIARTPDGTYQASLQTDEHALNTYRVREGATVEEAVRDVLGQGLAPAIPPPPY